MSEIFEFTMPIWEIIVRATVVYLVMIFFVRAIPSRNAGHISPNDLLTLIVVGTVGTSAIIGDGTSIPDISLMIALIFGWSYVLDRVSHPRASSPPAPKPGNAHRAWAPGQKEYAPGAGD